MPSSSRYDWEEIARYYEEGRTVRDCQRRFGFSNGAWDAAVARGDVRPRPRAARIHPTVAQQAVAELLATGMSYSAIGRELGVTQATISYHAARLGYPRQTECARRYDWAEVQRFYDEGHSIAECRRRFGMANRTFTDAVRRGAIVTRPQAVPMADLLVAGRPRSRSHLKGRLIRSGLKAPRCERCGLDRWHDEVLPLELHHVNGDGQDNRLENLQLLCPNCHSLTENWGGRGKRKAAA